jgi:hypothetical protein
MVLHQHMYIERHILSRDPFETIDSTGVGTLIGIARDKARNFNSNFRVSKCCLLIPAMRANLLFYR